MAANEGQDEVGEGYVEDGGEEERYEQALGRSQRVGGSAGAVKPVTLSKWVKAAMVAGGAGRGVWL